MLQMKILIAPKVLNYRIHFIRHLSQQLLLMCVHYQTISPSADGDDGDHDYIDD
jgi:hypothetical protein